MSAATGASYFASRATMPSVLTTSTITEEGSFYAQSPASWRDHSRAVPRAALPVGIGCGQGAPRESQDPFGDSQWSCRHQSGNGDPLGDRVQHHGGELARAAGTVRSVESQQEAQGTGEEGQEPR